MEPVSVKCTNKPAEWQSRRAIDDHIGRCGLKARPVAGNVPSEMSKEHQEPKWSLPYRSPLPTDPAKRKRARIARAAAYVIAAAALIAPVIQFQGGIIKRLRKAEKFDRQAAAGEVDSGETRPYVGKGALARWRAATYEFWAGYNIYELPPEEGIDAASNIQDPVRAAQVQTVYMHPNMPFTVILLSPFAYMPLAAEMLTLNILKVLLIAASCLMAARLANHGRRRITDWVLALGLLWAIRLIIGDIQHANTNCFVLAAVLAHLWLYRRGHDYAAGIPLALAICIKLTPALFLAYWLYQRNWKLLGATALAMVLMTVLVPLAALGPDEYAELTSTWGQRILGSALLKNVWLPVHVNQSLSGVAARYLLDGPNGNIFWCPEAHPYYTPYDEAWITLLALPEGTVQIIIRLIQAAIIAMMAWAIGWRKLPRDDGRRALHYGMVLLGMMLLNQRTWDHHAAVLLVAPVAIWQAIAFGRMSRRARAWALGLMIAAGVAVWIKGSELLIAAAKILGRPGKEGERWADIFEAYGPTFYYFALTFAAGVIVCLALRRQADPFADERQKLRG